VWSIQEGTWNNQDLAGLKVALLELGSANLAEKETLADTTEIFVPKGLEPAQKEALLSWISSQAAISTSPRMVETAISYRRSGPAAVVALGDSIRLSTTAIGKCSSGACGQVLWYEPKAKYSSVEVVASRASKIRDPSLGFLWTDHDRPNVFLASFGPNGNSSQLADSSCH
jgi:hypothetical protein